ncbi:MAG: hypothetical protein RSF94_02955 [Rikenellaceae bacterium]
MKITTGRKIVDYIVIVLVLTLFVIVGIYAAHRKKTLMLSEIEVNIKDSGTHEFITVDDVLAIVDRSNIKVGHILCSSIDVKSLKHVLGANIYIKKLKCYVGFFSGVLYIDIEQVEPLFRVFDRDGKSYYVDEDGRYVLKNNSKSYDIVVVTNNDNMLFNAASKKSAKKGDNIEKLVTFVKYINEDDFLTSLITQINITEGGLVEIVPCVGRQTIVLGRLHNIDQVQSNIYKIKAFYTEGRDLGLLSKYKKIDISHSNQIICTY